jgi:hypothetical protein
MVLAWPKSGVVEINASARILLGVYQYNHTNQILQVAICQPSLK